jgi:hypothetical protein
MIKRTAVAMVFLLAAASVLRADWKSELVSRLGRDPDYRAAYEFLAEESKTLEGEDRQTAVLILPFLAEKLGDRVLERDLAAEYFETYRDNDPDFGFLDEYTLRDFVPFWVTWKRIYPLVYDVNLLSYARTPATGLPGSVDVGLELLNDAFYRISLGPYILEGGYWPKGFHILTIPLRGLFDRSDIYDFVLDLKAGDIVCRRSILVRIDVADLAASSAFPPRPKDDARPAPGLTLKQVQEGEISLYVDNKLVLKSRKIAPRPTSFTFPLGGPSMPGQKPYMPAPKDDPMAHGVSVLDALALAYKAIKELVSKKPPTPFAPSYQKVSSLSFAYSRTASGGSSVSARASISLPPSKAVILKR